MNDLILLILAIGRRCIAHLHQPSLRHNRDSQQSLILRKGKRFALRRGIDQLCKRIWFIRQQESTGTHAPGSTHTYRRCNDNLKLIDELLVRVNQVDQLIENRRLALATLSQNSTYTQYFSKLAGQQSRHQEDTQSNPFLHTKYSKSVQRRHQEKIEGERCNHRGEHGSIAAKGHSQRQHNQQIDNRDIWNLGIELKSINQSSHSQGTGRCYDTFKQQAAYIERLRPFQRRYMFDR